MSSEEAQQLADEWNEDLEVIFTLRIQSVSLCMSFMLENNVRSCHALLVRILLFQECLAENKFAPELIALLCI